MTKKLSPEEIAEMSEDCQCSCKELDQLRADISQAYDLRDKAEGRYRTALGTIEQLHAAVKTAQELAATRLQEIERLRGALQVIAGRNSAEGAAAREALGMNTVEPVPAQAAPDCTWCAAGVPLSKDGQRHESNMGVWGHCLKSL